MNVDVGADPKKGIGAGAVSTISTASGRWNCVALGTTTGTSPGSVGNGGGKRFSTMSGVWHSMDSMIVF